MAKVELPAKVGSSMNIDDLRAVLSDEIRSIRDGEATAARVNAVSNAAGKILSTVKLQMEYYRLTGKPMPEIALLAKREE